MNTLHRQRGLAFFSIMIIFAVVGFAAVIAMRLLPLYLDDNAILGAMKAAAAEFPPNASLIAVRRSIAKNLEINNVSVVKAVDFMLVKDHDVGVIVLEYEARTAFVANIDFAVTFEHEVPLGGPAN